MKASWLLTVSPFALLCCQRAYMPRSGAIIPPGWVAVSPPAANSGAERCANFASEQWVVSLSADSTTLSITSGGTAPRQDTVRVGQDILAGNDLGEFGGALWHTGPNGTRDTIRVSGRDPGAFHADNLHAFVRRGDQVFALVGLAHMGLDVGELLYLSHANGGRWEARSALDLRGAPMAFTRISEDTILVVTRDSLLSVALDPVKPTQFALAGNEIWSVTYPSSVVRDRAGVVYIGMRSAVGRLSPEGHDYRGDWLVRSHCRVHTLGEDGKCSCKSSDD